jgi:hypothetical protein
MFLSVHPYHCQRKGSLSAVIIINVYNDFNTCPLSETIGSRIPSKMFFIYCSLRIALLENVPPLPVVLVQSLKSSAHTYFQYLKILISLFEYYFPCPSYGLDFFFAFPVVRYFKINCLNKLLYITCLTYILTSNYVRRVHAMFLFICDNL